MKPSDKDVSRVPIPTPDAIERVDFHFETYSDPLYRFKSYFDKESGSYLRTNILDAKGLDTELEPFMSSYPQLLDVGIMGHCIHGLEGKCRDQNGMCYQSGSSRQQPHMSFDNFKRIVDESVNRCFQFALGGRGDPDMHPEFERILAYAYENGIVPNMTTSGYQLTPEKAEIIARYCGAAAVSWYRTPYTERAIELLLNAGVRTNIHYVLKDDTLDEAIDLLLNQNIPQGINRLIFLLFKPIGEGVQASPLTLGDKTKYLFSLFETPYGIEKVGYDSCTVPGVVQFAPKIDPQGFDACEAGRFSAYITPDFSMVPCSFDQNQLWAVNLYESSIQEAWKSQRFETFRQRFKDNCIGCKEWTQCMGGCPIIPEITLCHAKKRGGVL